MNKTVREEGIEEGVQKGQREAIIEILEYRFGELPPVAQNRIQTMDRQQLVDVKKRIMSAQSLQDLGLE